MTDWADGIETRNYGIKNEINTHILPELMGIIITLAMVAAALLFYSWIRNQIVNTGYESQNLFAVEESLSRTQEKLILEEEVLRNPERIDIIARNDLGMAPLHPGQLILPQIRDIENGIRNEMAMAESRPGHLKRAAAMKHPGNYDN
ncbi:MAG: cell division protein FtsL [Acidobacteria bacterium]|nr:cell division protein FtsL [Acidobacteriota bacterium]